VCTNRPMGMEEIMKAKIEINMDNAAFGEDWEIELARILQAFRAISERHQWKHSWNLQDHGEVIPCFKGDKMPNFTKETVRDWLVEINNLRTVNADLLESCKRLIERANSVQAQSLGSKGYTDPYLQREIDKARAAISKAEEAK